MLNNLPRQNSCERGVHQRLLLSLLVLSLLSTFLVSCGTGTSQATTSTPAATPKPSQTAQTLNPGAKPEGSVQVQTTIIATGLKIPWSLAFLPDGRALVSERNTGALLIVDGTGKMTTVQTLPKGGKGEGGLLGIALSPQYATDKLVYAYYTTNADNRVVRFKLGEQPQVLLQGIPAAGNHNGGRIAFGPDGKLYIGTGDATTRGNSQNKDSLAGKILRMNPDGSAPADNPFKGSLVYSYGHRNVQGLAWNAEGQLYATEFGQNRFDEVNKIVPGGNYGWPTVEGMGNDPRFINPVATFKTSEASPSGATFLTQGKIPQWEGNFFLAGLKGTRLWRLKIGANGAVAESESLLQGQFGRLRLVTQAPDGSLWILTNNRDGRGKPGPTDDHIIRLGPMNG